MNELKEKFITEQTTTDNKPYFRITIEGLFTQQYANELCDEWRKLFSSNKDKRYLVVINAKEMTDYEAMARICFQKTILEFKSQIEKIWVVSDKTLIEAGAAVVSMFTSLSMTTVSSEDKIKL